MLTNLFNKNLLYWTLALIGTEILSYLSYLGQETYWGPINLATIFFLLASLAFALVTWQNLLWGCYLMTAEVILGVHGYLLFGHLDTTIISLRMAFFVILMIFWLIKTNWLAKIKIWQTNFLPLVVCYLALMAWGIIRAWQMHNQSALIIKDFQPWLFICLLPIFVSIIQLPRQFKTIWQILISGALVTSLTTITLATLFAHWPNFALTNIYPWLRIHYLAEVTQVLPNFFRYFSAGQIYVLIAWVLTFIIYFLSSKGSLSKSEKNWSAFCLLLFSTTLLLSLSRSFWLGLLLSLITLLIVAIRRFQFTAKKITWLIIHLIGLFIAANLIMTATTSVVLTNIFDQRISLSEAAATSRTAQLIPLISKINKHPIIGSGWGQTFTFKSSDPRIIQQQPNGQHTTFKSEWGFLDLWLKLGFIGLIILLLILNQILKFFWQRLIHNEDQSIKQLAAFALISLVALLSVHLTSPYLNHPLGITWLVIEATLIALWIKLYVHQPLS